LKKARPRLAQVKKALTQYVDRLNGLPARKKRDPTAGDAILSLFAPAATWYAHP
jgi:hypothetical protein